MKWINENKIYDKLIFVFEIFITLILGICIYKLVYKYQEAQYISKKGIVITVIISIFLITILVYNTIKYRKIIEKMFVTYVIPVGILFVILLPINWVPDEDGHIFKTYEISYGNFITPFGENKEGNIYVPKEILNICQQINNWDYVKIHEYLQKEANYEDLVPVQSVTKTYFPINYLSGAFTFFICRLLNINILLALYLVRLVNFILFIVMCYYSIKIIPFGKLLLAIYMFVPMTIQQGASLSADSFVNGISILFIAYNLKILFQNKDLSIKQRLIYYILAISISICKYVYFPLVFMSILLIKNKDISKKNRNKLIIISIILSIFVAIAWFIFGQQYVDTRLYIKEANVKPIEQMKFILLNPFDYLKILKDTIIKNGGYYLFTFVGQQLGLLNIEVPQIYSFIMLLALFVLPFIEDKEISFDKFGKWVVNLIAILLILLVFTGLYLTWSPLQYASIAGVQGRYFVPVFILVLLTFFNKDRKIVMNNTAIKFFVLFFIINILSVVEVFNRFFTF